MLRSRRVLSAVRSRRHAVGSRKAGGKRANASEADGEADVRDGAVGGAEKRRGTLQAPGEQVRVRRFAEGSPKLAAEVGARKSGGAGQILNSQGLDVVGVSDVFRTEQVAGRRGVDHLNQYRGHGRGG